MNDDLIVIPKQWWKSRTMLAALGAALIGLYLSLAKIYGWETDWIEPVSYFLATLGAIGLRTANRPIGDPGTPQPVVPVVASTEAVAVPADATLPDDILPPEGVILPRPDHEPGQP